MAVAAEKYHNPALAELRLLTEAEHFLQHMDADGNVPDEVFEAIVQNRQTAVAEIAMPYSVTTTEHEVAEYHDETGRRNRVISWLGRTALDVATSGYKYHFSAAAHQRVDVEVEEAVHAQERLRPGTAQAFISPRMTRYDATEAIAKAEHLHDDDSIRVSTAIVNQKGEMVGRKLQSLLVRDIPFDAWVKLFKDPGNIFGKALPLRDELSAVSVMELFSHMELPEDKLPEGPVTIVEAVLPYIENELVRQKVKRQLARFRGDQEFYTSEAKEAGREWAEFDLELARSLKSGEASDALRFFIITNGNAWNAQSLQIIESCDAGNSQYIMTSELASLLARAKQKLVGDELSAVTGNEEALKQVSYEARQQIVANRQAVQAARAQGADPTELRMLEQRQYQLLHLQPIRSGGGCPGEVVSAFGENVSEDRNGVGEDGNPFKSSTESKEGWQWKSGVCRVKSCPSPKPTKVGPCSVCSRCQREFDSGRDPTKEPAVPVETTKKVGMVALADELVARRAKKAAAEKTPELVAA